ncbi:MAG: 50S ribosomal protein L10 [Saprospiraceae bacterium]|jgi:large subunit ribosomal protein L10
MTKDKKTSEIAMLKDMFEASPFFYIVDASTMTVEKVNSLRGKCYEQGILMKVAKNTLIRKALESQPAEKNFDSVYEALHGPTAVLLADVANVPARLLKEFRKENDRPILKAAYIDGSAFIGDDQIDMLTKLKSKEELVGEVIGLLQSPASNLISALKSGGGKIAGLVKALEDRAA